MIKKQRLTLYRFYKLKLAAFSAVAHNFEVKTRARAGKRDPPREFSIIIPATVNSASYITVCSIRIQFCHLFVSRCVAWCENVCSSNDCSPWSPARPPNYNKRANTARRATPSKKLNAWWGIPHLS